MKIAILPIGDNYTMAPEDALKATKLVRPAFVIPTHYNTFPLIRQDAEQWARDVQSQTTSVPVVLQPGDTFTF